MCTSCSGRKRRERKGKKGSRWTKIKEKRKCVYNLRDRSQSRISKDILAGQTDGLKCDVREQFQKHFVGFVSSSTKCQLGGVLPRRIKCRGKLLTTENRLNVWMLPCVCLGLVIIQSFLCVIWYKNKPKAFTVNCF